VPFLRIVLVLSTLLPAIAAASPRGSGDGGPPAAMATSDTERAARLLSRYPAGRMPVDPQVLRAIGTLDVGGDRRDVPVLRSIVEREQPVLARLARHAIGSIRDRQRAAQRSAFDPDPAAIARAVRAWRDTDLGPAEAACAAYADALLGPAGPTRPQAIGADPEALLERGRAAEAVAFLPTSGDLPLAVRTHEEAGDVPGALRRLARAAAGGDGWALAHLEAYDIDVERLLLGLPHVDEVDGTRTLDTLVRRGGGLTIRVLAERFKFSSGSEQATAADALGRMLLVAHREAPLPRAERQLARQALADAAQTALPPVRPIALEALAAE
jgi:hypothetical protein